MTLADIKILIDTYLPDNTTGLITPSGQRIVLKTLADFIVSSQGEVETTTFVYDPAFTYDADDPVIYDGSWYLSLVGSNLNNQPDDSPSEWDPVNAFNTVLSIWELNAVYLGELSIVIKDEKLYLLDRDSVGDDPYVSTDFTAELSAGDWINLLPNTKPVANTYANDAAMIAAQGSQVEGYFYFAGATLYIYLGTTDGDIDDYFAVGGGSGGIASVGAGTGIDVDVTDPANPEVSLDSATQASLANADTAHGWGDHAAVGYLTADADYLASTGSILFDVKRKYGFTTAVTGNLTCGTTDAREDVVPKVLHNDSTEPTVTGPGGVTIVKDGGTYEASVDNIIYFVCHKNDSGTVTSVSYTITNNQP